MKIQKIVTVKIVILLTISCLLSGCQLFTKGRAKLNLYCPGLNIDIDGIGYSVSGAREAYILSYDQNFQKRVKNYFEFKENNFNEEKDNRLYDIEINDEKVIDESDNIIGKTVKTNKGTTNIVFNETTRQIIIVEYIQ